jgi:hypothetical protein
MTCDVIKDLMILYADGCCSDESRRIVEEHLKKCANCRAALKEMEGGAVVKETAAVSPAPRMKRVSIWKASLIQSAAMLVSFIVLVIGVAIEAYTPAGDHNGRWAILLIIPVTAFLLGQVNWYFVRLYHSRKIFSVCCGIVTLALAAAGFLWAFLHYGGFADGSMSFLLGGIALSAVLGIVSVLLSRAYAGMLGKE